MYYFFLYRLHNSIELVTARSWTLANICISVSFMQTNTNINNWRHICSKGNPADIISRGVSESELINNKLWFRRSEILNTIHYKIQQKVNINNLVIPEIKKSKTKKQTIPKNINIKIVLIST